MIDDKVFDVLGKASKDYYTLLISWKAQFPNNSLILKRDFNLTEVQLKKVLSWMELEIREILKDLK